MLFVIDGAKALRKAITDTFGPRALIQRCRQHKKRNVTDALPERMRSSVRSAMSPSLVVSPNARASCSRTWRAAWSADIPAPPPRCAKDWKRRLP